MNRQQRRHPQQIPTVEIAKLTKGLDDARMDGMQYATKILMAAMAMTLRDKYDFGPIRLDRFIGQIWDLMDSIAQGYLSVQDIHDAILEETGVEIWRRED